MKKTASLEGGGLAPLIGPQEVEVGGLSCEVCSVGLLAITELPCLFLRGVWKVLPGSATHTDTWACSGGHSLVSWWSHFFCPSK